MELQLQVTEEELLEFPEVRSNQFNISHSDKPADKVVIGTNNRTEKRSSLQNSCRSRGRCSADTHSKIKVDRPYYRRPVAHRRQLVRPKVQRTKGPKNQRKKNQDDRRLTTDSVHIPSIFDVQARPNLTAFAKTLTPEALRYLYLGIDLGQTVGNCP